MFSFLLSSLPVFFRVFRQLVCLLPASPMMSPIATVLEMLQLQDSNAYAADPKGRFHSVIILSQLLCDFLHTLIYKESAQKQLINIYVYERTVQLWVNCDINPYLSNGCDVCLHFLQMNHPLLNPTHKL